MVSILVLDKFVNVNTDNETSIKGKVLKAGVFHQVMMKMRRKNWCS